jgi:hypothetical protein
MKELATEYPGILDPYFAKENARGGSKWLSGRSAIPGAWTLTYLKAGGQWVYLYRAVDKQGKTVESYL